LAILIVVEIDLSAACDVRSIHHTAAARPTTRHDPARYTPRGERNSARELVRDSESRAPMAGGIVTMSARRGGSGARSPRRSALDELAPAEKAGALDELLRSRPELRAEAERIAQELLMGTDVETVAEEVVSELRSLSSDEPEGRAGRHRWGYMEPTEAARELLEETVGAFDREVERLLKLGMIGSAAGHGAGHDGWPVPLPGMRGRRAVAVLGVRLPARSLLPIHGPLRVRSGGRPWQVVPSSSAFFTLCAWLPKAPARHASGRPRLILGRPRHRSRTMSARDAVAAAAGVDEFDVPLPELLDTEEQRVQARDLARQARVVPALDRLHPGATHPPVAAQASRGRRARRSPSRTSAQRARPQPPAPPADRACRQGAGAVSGGGRDRRHPRPRSILDHAQRQRAPGIANHRRKKRR
jgi:hypothetical protein